MVKLCMQATDPVILTCNLLSVNGCRNRNLISLCLEMLMKCSVMKRRRVLKMMMMRNVLRMSLDRRHLSTIVIRESLSVSHLTHDTDPENILNKFHFFCYLSFYVVHMRHSPACKVKYSWKA